MTGAPLLPAAVRSRVVALASDRLSTLAQELVPAAVRPYARFHPRKRAAAAAVVLAAALESDAAFRRLVGEVVPPEVADAVRSGQPLPAAPAEELAAAAYLLRPQGWERLVEDAAVVLADRDRAAAGAAGVDAVQRLTEQLEALRATGRAETARLGEALAAARAEAALLRRKVREVGSRAAAAERALAAAPGGEVAPDTVTAAGAGAGDVAPGGADEVRRLHSRVRALEARLAQVRTAARSQARDDRRVEQVRLRVLLDALLGAASGLRRELALPPLDERPADAVAAAYAVDSPGVALQGRTSEDPALLDALLLVPAVHLLVDGYNVTKTGYGELTLAQQRARLVAGLAAVAARSGAEVTVVFDGAGQGDGARAAVAPRGVRVLFSPVAVIADDVLRELVAAEPEGRPLVVVSSDREVAGDVGRLGATAVASRALLGLLER